ncbi:ABC transporter permease [Eubacterium coprostanoligenes]|uniref:ABC transporter permease n=1 Tax=Eubacterium coprostanoligenes TaxID=290054 RepID=UPI002353F6E0|nr:ABC transporter permease [Eubacterium coprostanoligenes]MCI6253931.1 ABC transporter permease [Eubacterium coprostanoligenes]MCI6360319.1 ABC transporter permease [Eubacterium coprostanoligenes]MCI7264458.1 ABC transporter permease [Eubacterium coprostanoligenes]MDY4698456.1 ABC transporter permease [Eubacterium coprostanoligenes]MDY5399946.1 ABC transporter permease [Eubacterium coprostanoligenes]
MGFLNALPGAVGQGLIWGVMAIGVYITFRVLDFADLTVDGTLATGGAAMVMSLMAGCNVYLALLIAFVAGCLAGLVTGILNTAFGIPPILAGILTQLALYSINLRILGKANQPVSGYKYNLICSMTKLNQALIVATIFVLVIIALLYWFFGTEIGHAIRATGTNANMARANGININSTKIIALVLSNGLVALAGGLLAQYQGYADINMGRGAIVIGLAAVIIGEVLFGKIFKNFALKLLAVAIGGIIYYIVMQFVISLGLNTDDLKLLTAAVVAVFLGIPYIKGRYQETHIKTAKKEVK